MGSYTDATYFLELEIIGTLSFPHIFILRKLASWDWKSFQVMLCMIQFVHWRMEEAKIVSVRMKCNCTDVRALLSVHDKNEYQISALISEL